MGTHQEAGAAARLGNDPGAPVAAHVEVGSDSDLLVAQHDQLLIADREEKVIAGFGYLAGVPGEKPVGVQDL